MKIESNIQTSLNSLRGRYDQLDIKIFCENVVFDQNLLVELKSKKLNLTLKNMKVDLKSLFGRFIELSFNCCTFLTFGTEKLSTQILNLSSCKQLSAKFSTKPFQQINCKKMNIQQCEVDYLPVSLQELYVDSCQISIKNMCPYLKIIYNDFSKIINIKMSLLPVLTQIQSEIQDSTSIYIHHAISTRIYHQNVKIAHIKRVDKLKTNQKIMVEFLDQIEIELLFCFAKIMSIQGDVE
ncbi:Hypothetical_protein [Hexamita inflata]|uniref:Hypothetical_protein n=1 Tax=Hexamita inflata TaxID=28002 RepID=A0AA86QIP8_9EUKA|nr:Hypothetical protein HINF_LOCUS46663 [Hexamita inflata]